MNFTCFSLLFTKLLSSLKSSMWLLCHFYWAAKDWAFNPPSPSSGIGLLCPQNTVAHQPLLWSVPSYTN